MMSRVLGRILRDAVPEEIDVPRLAARAWREVGEHSGPRDVRGRAIHLLRTLVLGLYRGLIEQGMEPAPAREIAAEVAWGVWRRWLGVAGLWQPSAGPARVTAIARQFRQSFGPPHFDMEARGESGLDVRGCPFEQFFRAQGELELCQVAVCALDHRSAALRGVVLTRTQTLASGGERCDFRWSS